MEPVSRSFRAKAIDLQREYSYNAGQPVGTQAQVEAIQDSLVDDMVQAILFRLQAVRKHGEEAAVKAAGTAAPASAASTMNSSPQYSRPPQFPDRMPLNSSQWQKALAADSLSSVYLLAGEELLVLEAADALRAQARKLGYTERDVLDVGAHFDWDELARAGAGMSLFATRRLIDLRLPTGRPGTEGAKAITEFCAQSATGCFLGDHSRGMEQQARRCLDKAGR
jgi:hypothetical protein